MFACGDEAERPHIPTHRDARSRFLIGLERPFFEPGARLGDSPTEHEKRTTRSRKQSESRSTLAPHTGVAGSERGRKEGHLFENEFEQPNCDRRQIIWLGSVQDDTGAADVAPRRTGPRTSGRPVSAAGWSCRFPYGLPMVSSCSASRASTRLRRRTTPRLRRSLRLSEPWAKGPLQAPPGAERSGDPSSERARPPQGLIQIRDSSATSTPDAPRGVQLIPQPRPPRTHPEEFSSSTNQKR